MSRRRKVKAKKVSAMSELQAIWLMRTQEQTHLNNSWKQIDKEWELINNEWDRIEDFKTRKVFKVLTSAIITALFCGIMAFIVAIVVSGYSCN